MKKYPTILLLAFASLASCKESERNVSENNSAVVDAEKNLVDSNLNKNTSEAKSMVSEKPISPTIKGLHLGMDISEANSVCRKLLNQYITEKKSETLPVPEGAQGLENKVEFTELMPINASNKTFINLTAGGGWQYAAIGDMDNSGKYFQLVNQFPSLDLDGKYKLRSRNLLSVESDYDNKVIRIFISLEVIQNLFNSKEISNEEFAQKFIDAYGIPKLGVHTIPQSTLGAWRYNDPNKYILTIIPHNIPPFGSKWGGGDVILEMDSVKSQGNFN